MSEKKKYRSTYLTVERHLHHYLFITLLTSPFMRDSAFGRVKGSVACSPGGQAELSNDFDVLIEVLSNCSVEGTAERVGSNTDCGSRWQMPERERQIM